MDRDVLVFSMAAASSPALRDLIGTLVARCDEYDAMTARHSEIFAANRAKREGITVAQVKREAEEGAAPWALRPDEVETMRRNREQRIRSIKSDEFLLRHILASAKHRRETVGRWLKSKSEPPENRPLHQEQFDFLCESRRLLAEFAAANGWKVPDPY